MNKAQLVEAVAVETGLPKIVAKRAVEACLGVVIQTLRESDKVAVSEFGTFSVAQRSARVGRNPRTGAVLKIAPKKVVKFKCAVDID